MSKRQDHDGRVVYSTDRSARPVCSRCGADPCQCPQAEDTAAASHSARVQREKGGRGGKMVTIVYDLELGSNELKELAGRLKRLCATGGTVKDGTIVIQGDHAQGIVAELKALGYRARRSGG
jgi:translation initiation factor 1